MRERWHGTAGGYTNHGCRCHDCREAWRVYMSENDFRDRYRARLLGEGLTANGEPRQTRYNRRAIALMERFDVEPHPEFA